MKYFSIIIFIFLLACKNNFLAKPLPINQMKVIVWDMYCADEWFTEKQIRDSSLYKMPKERYKLYDQVFATHKITRDKFYADYQYYLEHTDQLKVLMDSVQSYGLQQRNRPIKGKLISIIPN